jgi:hypothetical protein
MVEIETTLTNSEDKIVSSRGFKTYVDGIPRNPLATTLQVYRFTILESSWTTPRTIFTSPNNRASIAEIFISYIDVGGVMRSQWNIWNGTRVKSGVNDFPYFNAYYPMQQLDKDGSNTSSYGLSLLNVTPITMQYVPPTAPAGLVQFAIFSQSNNSIIPHSPYTVLT